MTISRPPRKPLRSFPVGTRFPASVHAVTCSIPTMRDVIGYEEKAPETMASITSGYPRFVTHFYIRRIVAAWIERLECRDREMFVAASERMAREAIVFSGETDAHLVEEENLWGIHLPAASPGAARIKAFLQHTGGGISSRQAEAYLLKQGMITSVQHEERADPAAAEGEVRDRVAGLFGTAAENVLLGSSGMNAFYAVFHGINALQAPRGRTDWIQLGWLYVDTIEILRKLSRGQHHVLNDVLNLDALEQLLQDRGDRVAAIVTEIPTNPLLQTTDLHRLRELSRRFDIPLILDPTLASPHNIDVFPLADVVINSLTKYAASAGDVMMGAAIFNPSSSMAGEVRERAAEWITCPFSGDLQRMAVEMRDYEEVMDRINANALLLHDFLQGHPAIERVWSAYTGESGRNYTRLQRRTGSPGGIITIKLRKPVAEFYDCVQIPKGPSFGTTFTFLCPFLYLAHYDLVSTPEGRRYLQRSHLDPELLRISVGIEEIDDIIAAFAEAL